MLWAKKTFPILSAILIAYFPWQTYSQLAQNNTGRSESELFVLSTTGKHKFKVEIAKTPREQEIGLMYRTKLDQNAGMLFDYGALTKIQMWMKNTFIPLDMIFINNQGIIESFHERTVPKSLRIISSQGPVRAVLEVNAGTISRLKIKVGDRIYHKIFYK